MVSNQTAIESKKKKKPVKRDKNTGKLKKGTRGIGTQIGQTRAVKVRAIRKRLMEWTGDHIEAIVLTLDDLLAIIQNESENTRDRIAAAKMLYIDLIGIGPERVKTEDIETREFHFEFHDNRVQMILSEDNQTRPKSIVSGQVDVIPGEFKIIPQPKKKVDPF